MLNSHLGLRATRLDRLLWTVEMEKEVETDDGSLREMVK